MQQRCAQCTARAAADKLRPPHAVQAEGEGKGELRWICDWAALGICCALLSLWVGVEAGSGRVGRRLTAWPWLARGRREDEGGGEEMMKGEERGGEKGG